MSAPDHPVLELRIHGVNGTAPASVLGRHDYQVEQVAGDALGGFWQIRAHLPVDGDERDPVAPGVHREAYSWGGFVRGPLGGGRVLALAGRIGWALLLPFGLTNVAYWTRALPVDARAGDRPQGRGAAAVRAFGLGLTVLLVSALCATALDLAAVQCLAPGSDRCWGWLQRFRDTDVAVRLAVASLVPVAALLGLGELTRRSRLRYEEHPGAAPPEPPVTAHLLGRPELWRGGRMVGGLAGLHLAAGLAAVVLASAWPALAGAGTACREPTALLEPACRDQIAAAPGGQEWVFGAVVALGALVLAAALLLTCLRATDGPDVPSATTGGARRWTRRLLVAAAALLVVQLALLVVLRPAVAATVPLPGVNAVPVVVCAVLLGIATSALAWRSRSARLPGACGVLVTTGLLLAHPFPAAGTALAVVAAAALLLLSVRVERAVAAGTAWAGRAPGVLLVLALCTALVLTALLVVGAGAALGGSTSATGLLDCATGLCVAPAYVWFGSASVVTAVALLAAGALLAAASAVRVLRGTPLPAGELPPAPVLRARHLAALAHRAEPVTGLAAAAGLLTTGVAVLGAATAGSTPGLRVPDWWDAAVVTALAATAALLVGLLAGRAQRPLGLVWDLTCFLPRAAHPFAPPCYAERAVPELATRVRRATAAGRTVVVSAHSLGAVLAVAVLATLDRATLRSVRLLTYGVQLRAYFARLFPDLLGPAVLGCPPARAAALAPADPWRDQRAPGASTSPVPPGSVRDLLPGRWVSLWRHTDHLGFPAVDHRTNPVDRAAAEVLTAGGPVQAHSDYPATREYRDALADLLADPAPAPAPEPPVTPPASPPTTAAPPAARPG